MIDVQAMHCTTGQFHAFNDPDKLSPGIFDVQYLRARGQ
jgi:hypothetical protein